LDQRRARRALWAVRLILYPVLIVEHFDEPGYGPYDCDSGPITFSARAN